MNPLSDAGSLIVSTIVGLYLLCVLLRFLFQLFRADFRNPISQFIVTVTNPPLKLLRRFIPGVGGVDIASLVLALIVGLIEVYLLSVLRGHVPGVAGAAVLAVANILKTLIWILIIAMIIRIVLSWIQPQGGQNPLIGIIYAITEPIMAPARRIIPSIGGLDLSPILVFLALNVLLILVVDPLTMFGAGLAR